MRGVSGLFVEAVQEPCSEYTRTGWSRGTEKEQTLQEKGKSGGECKSESDSLDFSMGPFHAER
ncbi:hypothetical protein ABH19_10810 [Leptospirillum sp. Group II 'CF-1']|nr:hypothetical protein ABH19_10810 [Leptospirillum sp. Group II 'CF-1']